MKLDRVKVRGRTQKTYREWRSECGNYRVTWTCEIEGVTIVPPHYHATVLTRCRPNETETYWNFAGRRGPFKTLKKATEACEKNEKLWRKFIELSHADGRRTERLKQLNERAGEVLKTLPAWVPPEADPSLLRMQFRDDKRPVEEDDEALTEAPDVSESSPAVDSPAPEPVAKPKPKPKAKTRAKKRK